MEGNWIQSSKCKLLANLYKKEYVHFIKTNNPITIQQLDRECILNLNEKQICYLLDFTIKELCLVTEIHLKKELESNRLSIEALTNNFNQILILKVTVNKRVQLLKYFLKSRRLKRSNTIRNISVHLETQKRGTFIASCFSGLTLLDTNCRDKLFGKIQSLLLYNFYLEENSVIEFVSNPSRLFSDYYSKIDIPTSVSFSIFYIKSKKASHIIWLNFSLTSKLTIYWTVLERSTSITVRMQQAVVRLACHLLLRQAIKRRRRTRWFSLPRNKRYSWWTPICCASS